MSFLLKIWVQKLQARLSEDSGASMSKEAFRQAVNNTLERRLFYIPSFNIYRGVGLYDYGPPGCAIKANVIAFWQQPLQGVTGSYGVAKDERVNAFPAGCYGLARAELVTVYTGYPPAGSSSYSANNQCPPSPYLLEADDEDDLRFKLPETAPQWEKNLAFFLLQIKLRVPDVLLMAIFSVSLKTWSLIFLWFIVAPVAYRWDLGPVYILTTTFSLIFFNLGKRRQGDAGAYSIFNDGFRSYPGH